MSINESNLIKKFTTLTNTQDSVQTLSLWIIHHRAHHRKIVDIWAKVLKKSKPGHRLTMLYLANDVLQNGRRKGVQQFVESFADVLPHQTPLFRDEKIVKQVDRVFTIWSERSVYPADFTSGLKEILRKQALLSQCSFCAQRSLTFNDHSVIPATFSLVWSTCYSDKHK